MEAKKEGSVILYYIIRASNYIQEFSTIDSINIW